MVHFTRLPCAPPHLNRGGGGGNKEVSAGGVMPNRVEKNKPVAKYFNVFMVNRGLDFLKDRKKSKIKANYLLCFFVV
jgi:hypothetical protein